VDEQFDVLVSDSSFTVDLLLVLNNIVISFFVVYLFYHFSIYSYVYTLFEPVTTF
jgi:hypothetical protein